MKSNFTISLSSFLLLVLHAAIFGQTPGTFNTNFSSNGWDTVTANDNGFYVNKMIEQADGKILICGEANFSNEGHQAVVIRYNTNGTLDTEFGEGDGMVRSHDDYNIYTRAYGMALQNDGKIIIGGDQFYNSERIIRLNQNGSLDLTFGENGVSDFNRSNSEFIYHVGVQSDNKIIVCGRETRQLNGTIKPHVFLWRLTADGDLDPTFGNAGVVSYIAEEWQNVFEPYLIINDLIILPDDAILINQSFTGQTDNFVLLRKLNANGTSDNSFGVDGNAFKSKVFNWGVYTYSSCAVQEDGSIVSSITTRNANEGTYSESLFRVNAEGVEDESFALEFNVENPFPSFLRMAILGNKIYTLSKLDEQSDFLKIYCSDLNGNLVNNFGTSGVVELSQNEVPSSNNGHFLISANGTLYNSSSISDPNNNSNAQFLTSSVFGFPYESSVGMNKVTVSNPLTIYPNPSNTSIFIQGDDLHKNQYLITDIQGKTILYTTNNEMDVSEFPNGIYILRNITTAEQSKFVVLHN